MIVSLEVFMVHSVNTSFENKNLFVIPIYVGGA
jgi:hypothetical protein